MARVAGGEWVSGGEEETEALGRELGRELAPRGILLLDGDLGAGKTVLTRGVAAALGIDRRGVQSPTFTLVREHEGAGGKLIHVDLYRLEPEEVADLALEEIFAGEGVKVVEWASRLPFAVPGARRLRLETLSDGRRRFIEETAPEDRHPNDGHQGEETV